jgi:hypothetical protein
VVKAYGKFEGSEVPPDLERARVILKDHK